MVTSNLEINPLWWRGGCGLP